MYLVVISGVLLLAANAYFWFGLGRSSALREASWHMHNLLQQTKDFGHE